MKNTQPVHISKATYATVKKYAAAKGVTIGEAIESLVTTAIKRRAAVRKWAKANA